ncbi:DUF5689 domain-containing protein [Proteiniphilum sp. X52]|uniref:DUF5689 domain-containing protein n=1 Tax=Proteiniphilum sp. X52 TaxID=2382159 RepID=UPI000F0A0CC0|nr:DUF5689 domain-containing protein [Proteiniphilum sp. X52]RNC65404.1 hypothetical protein D7D25_07885 [Proteiniphilum sp. X52]
MKIAHYLFGFALAIAVLFSCERDFQAPPLTEPAYTGDEANMTIAKLKTLYANITDPVLIDVDYILRAIVIGNDISGNIYKQIYIQDETGGINMGVDQNSIFTEFRVGQEIYVRLKGLYMVMYGEQLQIGYGQTNANRIPWEIFNFYVHKNKWPQAKNSVPKTIKLSQLDQSMVNTLVKLENVYFVDGGKLPFSESDATTNRILKDGDGNSIIVRNSNYANFAADILPEGGGTLIAILSKYRADWQLLIRSIEDCQQFGQPIPGSGGSTPADPGVTTYYSETFGTADVSARPLIADYTGFDNKNVTYSDASGAVSLRTTSTFNTPHLWFPANRDGYLTIEGIDTSAGADETLVLNYELAANLFDAGSEMNLNAMAVTVDGTAMDVPSQMVSNANGDNNKVYAISLRGIPAKNNLKIEFHGKASDNKFGLRLDNISITTASDDVIVIRPK